MANPDELSRSRRLDVAELERLVESERDLQLIDVRQPGEASKGVIPGAMEIPLTRLSERLSTLDASKPTVVYCAGGYRSSIAASRMAAAGFADVADLLGGYGAWSVATAR
ncbi:MAG: rhodanese-like domain-containing protein [Ilumatobacteraceae bacterium]